MATLVEDLRKALQDVVAPDLKVIAFEVKELREEFKHLNLLVESQGKGFYAALQGLDQKIEDVRHGLEQKIDTVRSDLGQKMDGVRDELRDIKTEIKKFGNGSSR